LGSPSSRIGSPSGRSFRGRGAGVGAVATQANAEVSYGPRALELLAGAAQGGDLERGRVEVRAAIEAHAPWLELLERLPAELAPSAAAVLEALRAEHG
jgi:hypothetical protein